MLQLGKYVIHYRISQCILIPHVVLCDLYLFSCDEIGIQTLYLSPSRKIMPIILPDISSPKFHRTRLFLGNLVPNQSYRPHSKQLAFLVAFDTQCLVEF
jgi:hypothetical protein